MTKILCDETTVASEVLTLDDLKVIKYQIGKNCVGNKVILGLDLTEFDDPDIGISDKEKYECSGQIVGSSLLPDKEDKRTITLYWFTYRDLKNKIIAADDNTVDSCHHITVSNDSSLFTIRVTRWQPVCDFDRIKQSDLTNKLSCLSTKRGKRNATGTVSVFHKEISAKIEGYDKLVKYTTGLNAETWRFFDYLMKIAYDRGVRNNTVGFDLRDYMSLRGYEITEPMKRKARRLLKEELNLLLKANVDFRSRSSEFHAVLIQEWIVTRGTYYVIFNQGLVSMIANEKRWMFLPKEIWKINVQLNPHSYYFLKKITLIKSLKSHLISVKALIESSPVFPDYEKLKDKGNIKDRIIEPFERDLDVLSCIRWYYRDRSGNIIRKSEINDYSTFVSLNIKIDWIDYPELTIGNDTALG